MAEEIQEMVVRVKPEGVEETEDALESEAETFEETADTAEEEAGNLGTFSRKWQGAMTVITGALALAAGGLASQVPVVQDLMDGLMAVVESTALALDGRLRPSLQNVVNDLFDLAEAIGNEDGAGVLGALSNLGASLEELEEAQVELAVDLLISAASIDFGEGGLAGAMLRWFQSRSVTDFIPLNLGVRIGARFAEKVIEGMVGDFPGIIPIIQENAGRWRAEFETFAARLASDLAAYGQTWLARFGEAFGSIRDRLARFAVNARADFETLWTQLALATAEGANSVLSRLESFINKYIQAYNRVAPPGTAQLGAVSMGSLSTGGLRQNLSNIESRRSSQLGAINERGEQRASNIYADKQELTVRFEPAEFERFVSGELSDGPANRGRNPGVR